MKWFALALGLMFGVPRVFWPTAIVALMIRDREPFTPVLLWNLLLRYALGACFLVFAITANLRLMWVAVGVGVIAFVVARVGNRGRQDFGTGSRL